MNSMEKIIGILVCPVCKGPLVLQRENSELVCSPCRLAYPIRDGIPVMLPEEARALPGEEEVRK